MYVQHTQKQGAADMPTRLPHTDCSGRTQTHTCPALGQKLSQQRRGGESDAVMSDREVSVSVVHRSSANYVTDGSVSS